MFNTNTVEVEIVPWTRIVSHDSGLDRVRADVDEIFFAASGRTEFGSGDAGRKFHELWLGTYLANEPDLAWVAVTPNHRGVGYIVSSEQNPAVSGRFSALGYFGAVADLTAAIPAHLHINLDPDWRSRGIGARLLKALCGELARRGHSAVHAVTATDARNVGFYERNGFVGLATIPWRQRSLLFLARQLPGIDAAD